MNKVLNINLGGTPLTIDDDAYLFLENYLQSLHNHFRNSEGYEEIMGDIEARLGELTREAMGKRTIANIQDVKNTVSVMGTPEDFGAEPIAETAQKSKNTEGGSSNTSGIKTGKRLFRDEENKAVGGVCAGIAAYFGIEDPLWVRLAFLGLIFLFGTSVLLYFILWVIVPPAITTADRLAMRGEPIDVNSIAKSVEDGVEKLSNQVNQFGNPENQAKFNSQVHNASAKIGDAIRLILKGLGSFWKLILVVVLIGLVIAMLVSWVSGAVAITMAYPMFSYVTDSNVVPPLAIFAAFLSVTIPIVLMLMFLSRLLLKRPASPYVVGSLWAAFGIALSFLGTIAGKTANEFNQRTEYTQTSELANPNADMMTLVAVHPYGDLNREFGELKISDDYLLSENVQLRIVKTEGDKFELVKTVFSRGKNQEEARRLMNSVEYKMENNGAELRLPTEFQILKGTKWRGQVVNLVLKMPIGKKIKIDNTAEGRNLNINFTEAGDSDDNELCWEGDEATWEMTSDGLKCTKVKKKTEEE
jgi:phage shock protein PspC (stress-responsive transcriptional regulator)